MPHFKLSWTSAPWGFQANVGPFKAVIENNGMVAGRVCCGLSEQVPDTVQLYRGKFNDRVVIDQAENLEDVMVLVEESAEEAIRRAGASLGLEIG